MPTPGVALLIDWENIKHCAGCGAQDAQRLAIAASRYGTLSAARAYANWEEKPYATSHDAATLYQSGIEPVYVATRATAKAKATENSVDVKLAVDCLLLCFTRPDIGTFVLASGDHSLLHVVFPLKAQGKRVVVIAVQGCTAESLIANADPFIYYHNLPEAPTAVCSIPKNKVAPTAAVPIGKPELTAKPAPAKPTVKAASPLDTTPAQKSQAALEEIFSMIRTAVEERMAEGHPVTGSWLGTHIRQHLLTSTNLESLGITGKSPYAALIKQAVEARVLCASSAESGPIYSLPPHENTAPSDVTPLSAENRTLNVSANALYEFRELARSIMRMMVEQENNHQLCSVTGLARLLATSPLTLPTGVLTTGLNGESITNNDLTAPLILSNSGRQRIFIELIKQAINEMGLLKSNEIIVTGGKSTRVLSVVRDHPAVAHLLSDDKQSEIFSFVAPDTNHK